MTILRPRSRIVRRAAAWLALASMVLNAAWPVLANAKPYVPASPSEICSATGLDHAAGGSPAGSRGRNFHASHCALCLFGAERCAAIAHVVPLPLPPARALARAFAPHDAPRPDTALLAAARPRAPPFFS